MNFSNGLISVLAVGVVVAAGAAQTLPYLCFKPCKARNVSDGSGLVFHVPAFACPCHLNCSYTLVYNDEGVPTGAHGGCSNPV